MDATRATPLGREVRADIRAARSPPSSNHPRASDLPSLLPSPLTSRRPAPAGTRSGRAPRLRRDVRHRHGGRDPSAPPPRGHPRQRARSGAFGFTCDSDSDGDDALLGSAARAVRLGRTPTLRPGSVSSAQRARSRELAAARSFREASRERATLKQHCDALEEKVRLLEATARSDAADRSDAVDAETAALRAEAASLRAELVAAAENDEWLRRALEERAAAANISERERAALTSRVADLERSMEEAETCLRAASHDADKLRRRHRRATAAAKAAKLAAEATVAGLRAKSHVCTPRSNARGCTPARPGPSSRPRTA